MKAILATLIATTALAVSFSYGEEDGGSGSAANGSGYLMVAGETRCAIAEAPGGAEAKRVHFGSGCDAGPMTGATHIVERDDGSVDLVTSRGEPVIRFAAAEGGTHVSYEPQSPLIQLITVE